MRVKLKDIATVKLGYLVRKSDEVHARCNANIVMPKDVDSNGALNYGGVSPIYVQYPQKHALSDGEVLLVSRGRIAAALFRKVAGGVFIASSLFLRIIVKDERILPEYIWLYLNSFDGRNELKKYAGTMLISSVNKAQLENLEIPLISMQKQEKLARVSEEFRRWNILHARQADLKTQLINLTIRKLIGEKHG